MLIISIEKSKGGDFHIWFFFDEPTDAKIVRTFFRDYVLLIGEEGRYRIAGAMESAKLCVPERYGHHKIFKVPCFMATQDELTPWEEYVNA